MRGIPSFGTKRTRDNCDYLDRFSVVIEEGPPTVAPDSRTQALHQQVVVEFDAAKASECLTGFARVKLALRAAGAILDSLSQKATPMLARFMPPGLAG
jgi:hypothetical protein